jgi:hypothetical protein
MALFEHGESVVDSSRSPGDSLKLFYATAIKEMAWCLKGKGQIGMTPPITRATKIEDPIHPVDEWVKQLLKSIYPND